MEMWQDTFFTITGVWKSTHFETEQASPRGLSEGEMCVCVFTARSYARVVDGGGQVIVTVWTDLTHVCISYSACHHADITCDNRSFFFSSPCSISTLRSSTGIMFYVWLGTKRAG